MTFAGELDGLMRITRMAEQYVHTHINSVDHGEKHPMITLTGLNHVGFANVTALGNQIPEYIKNYDLKSEDQFTYQQTIEYISNNTVNYFQNINQNINKRFLTEYVNVTNDRPVSGLLGYLAEAMQLEASKFIKP